MEERGKCPIQIKHPEWLQVGGNDGQTIYGFNQEWYTTSFQRTRGCGPTVAAMLLTYINQREADRLPYQSHSISTVIEALEDVWEYVTPGWLLGLNSTDKFCRGLSDLFRRYGLRWRCKRLSIPVYGFRRANLSQVVNFLEDGLGSDCPIAFLNLHRGRITGLDSWHWVVIVSLSYNANENRYWATCYDAGGIVTVDLALWLETTKFGGGFVFIEGLDG